MFRKAAIGAVCPCQFAVFLLLLASVLGCGNSNGTVKVSGVLTVAGGPPPGPGTISFTVVQPADGFPNRPAMAKFGDDGVYKVTTYDPGDGLLPGKYQVAVECYETPPNMDGKPVKSFIDKKYMNGETSGFELNIEPNSKAIEFNLELD